MPDSYNHIPDIDAGTLVLRCQAKDCRREYPKNSTVREHCGLAMLFAVAGQQRPTFDPRNA